jgi:hypothetical protein
MKRIIWRIAPIAFLCAALAVFGGGGARFGVVEAAKACSRMALMGVESCGSSGGSFSLTYESQAIVSTAASTIDFGTLTYGSGCTRVVIALTGLNFSSPLQATSVTVNGVSATAVSGAYAAPQDSFTDVWETNSSVSGSSGDVSVTYNESSQPFGSPGMSVALYCLVTAHPTATSSANNVIDTGSGATSISATITVPSGGAAVGVGLSENCRASPAASWTSFTTDGTPNVCLANRHSTTAGSNSPSFNIGATADYMSLSLAAWGP